MSIMPNMCHDGLPCDPGCHTTNCNRPIQPAASEKHLETVHYLQVEPQHYWHHEAIIRGNASALRELARALMAAADGQHAATEVVFASDGEGYGVEVYRMEKPDDFPPPFYTCQHEHRDYGAGEKQYCGKCGRPK